MLLNGRVLLTLGKTHGWHLWHGLEVGKGLPPLLSPGHNLVWRYRLTAVNRGGQSGAERVLTASAPLCRERARLVSGCDSALLGPDSAASAGLLSG